MLVCVRFLFCLRSTGNTSMRNKILQHLWLNKQIKNITHKLRTQRLISIKKNIQTRAINLNAGDKKGNYRIISHRLKRSIRRVSWWIMWLKTLTILGPRNYSSTYTHTQLRNENVFDTISRSYVCVCVCADSFITVRHRSH